MVKYIGHLAVIGILIIVFFALMILSTSNKNVTIEYSLVDSVEITKLSELDIIKIGDATIENNGILSSRLKLKNYVICQQTGLYDGGFSEIQYRGASTVQGNSDFFSYNYYQRKIDVSSKERIELDITTSPYSISKYNIEQDKLYNSTIPLYLYEVGDNIDVWNYCNSAKTEDATKVINVKINIDPKEIDTPNAIPVKP